MKTILAIDTSTDVASVALVQGLEIIWEREIPSQKSHSSSLFPVLEEAKNRVAKLDCIAVGLGPGSYAGVRIAIAAALGLQMVLGCELVGIPSVLALRPVGESFRVVGDARRGTWYYSQTQLGECIDGPRLVESDSDLQDLLSSEEGPLYSTDEVCSRWAAKIALPRAGIIGQLAFMKRGVIQTRDLEPLYLREPHITLPKRSTL